MRYLVLVMALLAPPAFAECTWAWQCDGACRQVPLCDRVTDIPSVPPVEVAPIEPLSIPPIELPAIPPPGTTHCREEHIFVGGQWAWQQICE